MALSRLSDSDDRAQVGDHIDGLDHHLEPSTYLRAACEKYDLELVFLMGGADVGYAVGVATGDPGGCGFDFGWLVVASRWFDSQN